MMQLTKRLLPCLFLTLLSLAGCIPYRKVVLFQQDQDPQKMDSVYVNQDYEFTIAPFDVLSLRVNSTVSDVAGSVAVFNPAAQATGGNNVYQQGILVDKEGSIEIPYAGKIKVSGLTLAQATDTIRNRLSVYIQDVDKNLFINLKILNYTVQVLGEVGSPGIIQAQNEYMTVTEVLAKAGGVTDLADRQNIKIIRTNRLTKQTTTYRMDLTDDEAISPILARLQPNDVIYVKPLRRKQFGSATQVVGLASAFISIPLLIISIYNVARSFN